MKTLTNLFAAGLCFAAQMNCEAQQTKTTTTTTNLLNQTLMAGTNAILTPGGAYNGLIYDPNDWSPEKSGFFILQVSSSGEFTGKFRIGEEKSVRLHGTFDTNGMAEA